ncbi:hypothetical protein [Jannaschia aquimarina]|uniref:Uncharacterized protein n=1 Tax=Jannaschia aquimarina TaxID=935700 RepID=A0A0D1E9C7_9RHOB|nr:hypothetical protein [Jannaschia aquimarina]KIT14229.1 hypothetical protein jaqu_40230 [Jannaschia aquimarina]SNS48718.1 hypothetical protein SAMN05421775_101143 [Jannaschia aquimarina]
MPYARDSLFTLEAWQIAGVLAVAGLLAAIWVGLALRTSGPWPVRLAFGAGLAWSFEWLSPQVFYLYYLAVLEGLPLQWVIGWPPAPARMLELLTFGEAESLSGLGRGLLGWVVILLSLWRRGRGASPSRSPGYF